MAAWFSMVENIGESMKGATMLERNEINIVCKLPASSKATDRQKVGETTGAKATVNAGPSSYPPFARILVAVDESEPAKAAIETAETLASKTGAAVRLVHVVDATRNWNPESAMGGELSYEFLRSEGEWLLRRAQKRLGRQISSKWELLVGLPQEMIVADAKQWNADVIVIGTHGRGRLGTLLLGSTAQAVVANADCPVLVVGPRTLNRVK